MQVCVNQVIKDSICIISICQCSLLYISRHAVEAEPHALVRAEGRAVCVIAGLRGEGKSSLARTLLHDEKFQVRQQRESWIGLLTISRTVQIKREIKKKFGLIYEIKTGLIFNLKGKRESL